MHFMAITEMSPEHFENIVQLLIITAAQLVTFHQKITEWTTGAIASTLRVKKKKREQNTVICWDGVFTA